MSLFFVIIKFRGSIVGHNCRGLQYLLRYYDILDFLSSVGKSHHLSTSLLKTKRYLLHCRFQPQLSTVLNLYIKNSSNVHQSKYIHYFLTTLYLHYKPLVPHQVQWTCPLTLSTSSRFDPIFRLIKVPKIIKFSGSIIPFLVVCTVS